MTLAIPYNLEFDNQRYELKIETSLQLYRISNLIVAEFIDLFGDFVTFVVDLKGEQK